MRGFTLIISHFTLSLILPHQGGDEEKKRGEEMGEEVQK
jgi:hypothetical protein